MAYEKTQYVTCSKCGINKHDPKWKICFPCKQAGQATTPQQARPVEAEDAMAGKVGYVGEVLDLCMEKTVKIAKKWKADYEFTPDQVAMMACHLSGQFGKNERTP